MAEAERLNDLVAELQRLEGRRSLTHDDVSRLRQQSRDVVHAQKAADGGGGADGSEGDGGGGGGGDGGGGDGGGGGGGGGPRDVLQVA